MGTLFTNNEVEKSSPKGIIGVVKKRPYVILTVVLVSIISLFISSEFWNPLSYFIEEAIFPWLPESLLYAMGYIAFLEFGLLFLFSLLFYDYLPKLSFGV